MKFVLFVEGHTEHKAYDKIKRRIREGGTLK